MLMQYQRLLLSNLVVTVSKLHWDQQLF